MCVCVCVCVCVCENLIMTVHNIIEIPEDHTSHVNRQLLFHDLAPNLGVSSYSIAISEIGSCLGQDK